MKSAVLYGPHDWRIEESELAEPGKDELLIKIKACGVCHSEIHQWDKKIEDLKYPRYIGHEVSGVVIATGDSDSKFKPGDKVAAWADGKGYAEEIIVNEKTVMPVAENIPLEHAMSEPIACTTNAVLKMSVRLGDTIALAGTGFMGLILLQQLKYTGARKIIAIDIRDEMLKLAEELGADIILNPKKQNVKKYIKEITGNKGVDIAIEAGGAESTINLAADICRMEGKLVIFGFHPGRRVIEDFGYWNWMAFDIINAHFRDMNTILNGTRIGMEMLNDGKIKMDKLITHRFELYDIENAFKTAKDKPEGFVKSVIVNDN
jgi:threonine dehydrogenase-like Zn-dependent dehydrogenase